MILSKKLSQIFLCLLFFLILLVTTNHAQGLCDVYDLQFNRIRGKVLSDGPQGDEPILNAKIELRRTDKDSKVTIIKTVFSDKYGYFDFGMVQKGKYLLAISQEDLQFVNFFTAVKIIKEKKKLEKERALHIRLGVSVLKPCGGGKAWVVENP